MNADTLGRRLTELRQSRGLSLRELAEKAGVSHGTVWEIERGGDCRLCTVARLAQALNVETHELTCGAVRT